MRLRTASSLLPVVVLGCTLNGAPPSGRSADAFTGLTHPPLPAGVEDLGGYVIDPTASMDDVVGHMRDANGEMLWLERITSRDAQGRPTYQVLAVQRLPPLREGDGLSLGLCYVEGEMDGPDGTISGVAVWEDAEVLRNVRHAWRVHVASRRFEALAPERVRCINEGAGL